MTAFSDDSSTTWPALLVCPDRRLRHNSADWTVFDAVPGSTYSANPQKRMPFDSGDQ